VNYIRTNFNTMRLNLLGIAMESVATFFIPNSFTDGDVPVP
jgi:hypothetical protein